MVDRSIIFKIATLVVALLVTTGSIAQKQLFIEDITNVNIFGGQNGSVLTYDSAKNTLYLAEYNTSGIDLSATSDHDILYNDNGNLAGSNNFEYDGTNFTVSGSLNPRIKSYRNNTGAAYFELANTSNAWWWYSNGANAGFEPATANARFYFRNLANTEIFNIQFGATGSASFVEVKNGATFRASTKGGTALSLAAYDAEQDLSDIALGDRLSLSSGTINALSHFSAPDTLDSDIEHVLGTSSVTYKGNTINEMLSIHGITGVGVATTPQSNTSLSVRSRIGGTSGYAAKFFDSSGTEKFGFKSNGDFIVSDGYTQLNGDSVSVSNQLTTSDLVITNNIVLGFSVETAATVTITDADHFVRFDATSNAIIATLPNANDYEDGTVIIDFKGTNNSSNSITINASGGNVGGSVNYVLSTDEVGKIISYNGNWEVWNN